MRINEDELGLKVSIIGHEVWYGYSTFNHNKTQINFLKTKKKLAKSDFVIFFYLQRARTYITGLTIPGFWSGYWNNLTKGVHVIRDHNSQLKNL